MFETLTRGFRSAKNRLKGEQEIDEQAIADAVRDVRVSLLEADVEYKVTKRFISNVKERAVGEIVSTSAQVKGKKRKVTPSDHFIAICQKEMEAMMGPVEPGLNKAKKGQVNTVMMVGLQGSGKTTTAGKLARWLEKEGHRPMLVAADVYRPAAVEQLQVLGDRLGMPVFKDMDSKDPVLICERSMFEARRQNRDVLIFDTAGRLAIDEPLMEELDTIKKKVRPKNIFFVLDAMIGQDAVNTAAEFHRRLDITGVILTKIDGDARGGAALSVKEVTGAPIKFLGVGEELDKLEEFRPEGLASRVLGFGDVVGLMKDFEEVVDQKKAEEDARRLLKGAFTFDDFLEQIHTLKKMGSLQDTFEKMPFFPDGLPEGVNLDDRELVRIESIVSSMTRQERLDPRLFDKHPTRIARVARGSGRDEKDVRELIAKFKWMKNLMGGIGQQAGALAKIPGMKQMAMAHKLKDQIRLQGAGHMEGLATEMLESAVAEMGGPAQQPRYVRAKKDSAKRKKRKRKQQRKSRKKSRKK
jgi:signal recognition particle subunit SRP54